MPLGLLHQHRWTRDPATIGRRHTRRQRSTAEQESQRWLDAQTALQAAVPAGMRTLTVADREADRSDLFALPRPAACDRLIRACRNRRGADEAGSRWPALDAAPVVGLLPVALPRRDDRPPREAVLAVRGPPVTLLPPRHHPHRATLAPLPLVALRATEVRPPADQPAAPAAEATPVDWRLLTTRPVATVEAAVACVRAYAARWLVERFPDVRTSGCRVEALQLRTIDRLERAVATYSLVAWRLVWLTYQARADPDQPCAVARAEPAWRARWAVTHPGAAPPREPPPLGTTVRALARLGGFLGRRSDGEPGVTVRWRGLRRVEDITLGWQTAHHTPPPVGPPPVVGNA